MIDGYRGVYETSYGGSWQALIKHRGRLRYLGSYDTTREAALAFNRAALNLRGPGARINDLSAGGEPQGSEPQGGDRQ